VRLFQTRKQSNGYYACGMRANGYRTSWTHAKDSRGIEGLSVIFCSVYDQDKEFD